MRGTVQDANEICAYRAAPVLRRGGFFVCKFWSFEGKYCQVCRQKQGSVVQHELERAGNKK